jgi:Transcriptional regulator, AbiEi antitoxin, Type IV TA system/IclR helix-turn-helix domain
MFSTREIRNLAIQRLRELFPQATTWQESSDVRIGAQTVDLLVKFRMGQSEHVLALEIAPVGHPRELRHVVARLGELRRERQDLHTLAVAPYISGHGAALLKRGGLGYLDLSGNCYLAFDNVLIEKEGKPNRRPSTRPLKALFAPRATRVVRALLTESERPWRLEELARSAGVSIGHAHNVIKRLQELSWVERGQHQRIHLAKPADLLEGWVDTYSYRVNVITSYFSPERATRKLMGDLGRLAQVEGRRYAFTLHSGAALVAPNVRFPAIHCYVEGDPDRLASGLGLRPAEGDGNVYLMTPYDEGVFYAPIIKSGVPVACLPQLYVDLYHYERRGREQANHLRRTAMGY